METKFAAPSQDFERLLTESPKWVQNSVTVVRQVIAGVRFYVITPKVVKPRDETIVCSVCRPRGVNLIVL